MPPLGKMPNDTVGVQVGKIAVEASAQVVDLLGVAQREVCFSLAQGELGSSKPRRPSGPPGRVGRGAGSRRLITHLTN